ncbi:MAG: hypothetical protein WBK08_16620 [Nitrospira sp.]
MPVRWFVRQPEFHVLLPYLLLRRSKAIMSLFVARPLSGTVLTERLVNIFYDSPDWLD